MSTAATSTTRARIHNVSSCRRSPTSTNLPRIGVNFPSDWHALYRLVGSNGRSAHRAASIESPGLIKIAGPQSSNWPAVESPSSGTDTLAQHRGATIDTPGLLERLIETRSWLESRLRGCLRTMSSSIFQAHDEDSPPMTCVTLHAIVSSKLSLAEVSTVEEEACDFIADSSNPRHRSALVVMVTQASNACR